MLDHGIRARLHHHVGISVTERKNIDANPAQATIPQRLGLLLRELATAIVRPRQVRQQVAQTIARVETSVRELQFRLERIGGSKDEHADPS